MTYIALLRGINLAGKKKVAMSDVRDLLAALGFSSCRTLLQSGNSVFEGPSRAPARIEKMLEDAAEKHIGLGTDFFVRTAAEWKELMARNPFPGEAMRDPGRLAVVFLKTAPAAANVKALQAAIVGREVLAAEGRQAYIVYPDGMGRSRLTHALIERHLGTRGTARNWNTVTRLGGMAC